MRNQISASLTIDASALAAVIRSEIAPMFEQIKVSLQQAFPHPTSPVTEHAPVTDAPIHNEADDSYTAECACGVYFCGYLIDAEEQLRQHLTRAPTPPIPAAATHAPLSAATYIADEETVGLLTDCGLDALQALSLMQKLHNNGAALVWVPQS